MAAHKISSLTGPWAAQTLRLGDLMGDGSPALLLIQSEYETRAISCLTAVTIAGKVLWQWGYANTANCRIYSDLPVQIYDWDGDGRNEVLWIQQAEYLELPPDAGWPRERAIRYGGQASLVVLEGATGREKQRLPLPAPADDCLVLADLTGRGRPTDLIVKDRYWNAWGVAHDGTTLWEWSGSTGHFPAVADVDGDGCDEIFFGFTLLDHDGRELWSHPADDHHQDATYIVRDQKGEWRLLFGNGGLHCLDVDGRELWQHALPEAQHVVAGRFRTGAEFHVAVINRGQMRESKRGPAELHLYDLQGNEIWCREQPPGSWAAGCLPLHWNDPCGLQEILVYNRGSGECDAIYDGMGNIIELLPYPFGDNTTLPGTHQGYYSSCADVWGDGREEILMSGGAGVCIYANNQPLALPRLYNHTLYPGM